MASKKSSKLNIPSKLKGGQGPKSSKDIQLTDSSERKLVHMNNNYEEERRMSQRFPFREEILIDGAKQCTCNDISEGGIFISTILTFEEGEMIDITIPFGEEQITVKGQIKYCQHGIGIGVMFHGLNDEVKD